jgi:ornithine cyclodeaminase/alanine dehydrogenase-like protein (mu-crystallin family)
MGERPASRLRSMSVGPLRYLSSADVMAALPDVETRTRLAEQALVALGRTAQLPPKIGVQPRGVGSLAHAMPAILHGGETDGSRDLLGVKWVVGFPSNVAVGLPAIHGTTILSDAVTGQPRAFLDAGALTAHRTAAVSGVAIRHWGPSVDWPARVALVGSGAQARSHLPVVGHLMPGASVVVCGRDPGRLDTLLRDVESGGIGEIQANTFSEVRVTTDMVSAVSEADVVITMISFGSSRQVIPADAFEPGTTIVAVDYDMCVPASLAAEAALFVVDDREQYLANRKGTVFQGYPTDLVTFGEAMLEGRPRPSGRVLATHLGVGLADVVFADAVLRTAEERGIGSLLPR